MIRRLALFLLISATSQSGLAFEELDITTGKPERKDNKAILEEGRVIGVDGNTGEEPTAISPRPARAPAASSSSGRDSSLPSWMSLGKISAPRSTRERFSPENAFYARVGITMNQKDLGGRVGGYGSFNRWSGIGMDLLYRARHEDIYDYNNFASEIYFRGQAPNLTLFTPYVFAGPGYESWKLKKLNKITEKTGSFTVLYGGGVELAMSRYFGMAIQHQVTRYEHAAPKFRDGKPLNSKDYIQERIEVMFQYII